MKKWKLKKMKEAAAQLKQTGHVIMEIKSGKEILELNPKAVDKSGNPIDANKAYSIPKPIATSNYRKVKKYFKTGENKKELNKFLAG